MSVKNVVWEFMIIIKCDLHFQNEEKCDVVNK